MIFAEILNRRGQIEQRFSSSALPVRIGRGYACDVILDDPYVAPEHAEIDRDASGELVLRDLGSENGIYDPAARARCSQKRFRNGECTARIGQTRLRFRTRDYQVAPVQREILGRPLVWLVSHWSGALALGAVVAAFGVLQRYRISYGEVSLGGLLGSVMQGMLVQVAVAAGWALLGRLLSHRPRFGLHWAAICGYAVANGMLNELQTYLSFLLASVPAVIWIERALGAALLAVLLFAHLSILGVARRPLRAFAAGAAAMALIWSVSFRNRPAEDRWVSEAPYWSTLKPFAPSWLPRASVDEFFGAVPSLQSQVDALAVEED